MATATNHREAPAAPAAAFTLSLEAREGDSFAAYEFARQRRVLYRQLDNLAEALADITVTLSPDEAQWFLREVAALVGFTVV
jgi:hypothetical protein